MNRLVILILLLAPSLSFPQKLYFPSNVTVDSTNPAAAFPEDIQQNFSIAANLNNDECKKSHDYMLTMLIYRNAVDNKIVGTYRAKNTSALCWVDFMSYSDKWIPDLSSIGWTTPKAGENTWCSQEGLINTSLCYLTLLSTSPTC